MTQRVEVSVPSSVIDVGDADRGQIALEQQSGHLFLARHLEDRHVRRQMSQKGPEQFGRLLQNG
jgi:hypothetical protein